MFTKCILHLHFMQIIHSSSILSDVVRLWPTVASREVWWVESGEAAT